MTKDVATNVCAQLIEAQQAIMESLLVPLEFPIVELNENGVPIDSAAIAALAFATHQLAEVLRARTMLAQSSAYSTGFDECISPHPTTE